MKNLIANMARQEWLECVPYQKRVIICKFIIANDISVN